MANDAFSGVVGWRCPSNIAITKYWGKSNNQIPNNSSVSFTLSNSFTETIIQYESLGYQGETPTIDFYFDGKLNEVFKQRIEKFIRSNAEAFEVLNAYHLSIESNNSFPHSAGIASSASSMSALTSGLLQIMHTIEQKDIVAKDFNREASYLSRLASGSACRSIYPHLALWGESKVPFKTSNEYAVPLPSVHPDVLKMKDDILIIDKAVKSVSSTAGHKLMEDNPFAKVRYKLANKRTATVVKAIENGDILKLGKILEAEALNLHALMMSSKPNYILMEPNSLAAIKAIREFRKTTKEPVFFTLDAGANVHMIHFSENLDVIDVFKKEQLVPLCQDGRIIEDHIGNGPEQITGFSI